jgi:hydrogenase maturation factor
MTDKSQPLTFFEPIADSGAYCIPDQHGHCITCSDEAQPVTVVSVMDDGMSAMVLREGQHSEIDISLVDDVAPGDVLLAHGGVALGKVEAAS